MKDRTMTAAENVVFSIKKRTWIHIPNKEANPRQQKIPETGQNTEEYNLFIYNNAKKLVLDY